MLGFILAWNTTPLGLGITSSDLQLMLKGSIIFPGFVSGVGWMI